MSTFHPFPRLPQELRAHIWSLAAHPRLVHVRVEMHESRRSEIVCVITPTPSPPVMQVCHESRQHGPYRRAFTIGSEPRYVWVNFETDMIGLHDTKLNDLEPHRLDIQRLRFTARNGWQSYDFFYHFGIKDLEDFPALKEIHVAIDKHVLVWSSTFEDCYWGVCPKENIRFIDNTSGFMLSGYQMSAAADWGTFYSWDSGGKIQDINNIEEEIEMYNDDSHMSLSDIRNVE